MKVVSKETLKELFLGRQPLGLVWVLGILLAVCLSMWGPTQKEEVEKINGVYTVKVGGPVVSLGYQTDSYEQIDNTIHFVDLNTKTEKIVFLNNVFEIDKNQQ